LSIFPLDDVLSGGTRQLRTELVKGTVTTATLQNAVNASSSGTDFTVDGYGVATLQITGTFVATVTFYGSVDGVNFINISAQNRNTGERVLTTTTTGLYEIDCRGLQKIRASVTWTSGTSITIVGRAEPFAGSNSSIQITGRKAQVKTTTLTSSTTVAVGGNETSRFTIPAGKMWTILDYYQEIVPPTGATSGTHSCTIKVQGSVSLMRSGQNYDKRLHYNFGTFYLDSLVTEFSTGVTPSDKAALARTMKDVKLQNGISLEIIYYNNTNADQTNQRNFIMHYLEEDITA